MTHSRRLRIGYGTDLHRLVEGRPLILGGVHIESSLLGCEAHSDGDVVLHALIDALLGATAQGDIGEWFSPSDPQWKGANSAELLRHVLEELAKRVGEFEISNIDCTIELQKPKLKTYKEAIRENLADLLMISLDQVSVKAKTAEGLGPVGTSQAIAAQVSLLLCLQE